MSLAVDVARRVSRRMERRYRAERGSLLGVAWIGAAAGLATCDARRSPPEARAWCRAVGGVLDELRAWSGWSRSGEGAREPASVENVEGMGVLHFDCHDRLEVEDLLRPILRPEEWAVIQARFLDGETQQATGEALGLSESRVCQIQRAALERARRVLGVTGEPGRRLVNRSGGDR